ncbi:MAG: phage shock protein [Patescibacteria group bacterium]|nr:phage shock protein [Patescibacteria group bacterium]
MTTKKIIISVVAIVAIFGLGAWLIIPNNSSNTCSAEQCNTNETSSEIPLAKQASDDAGQQQAYLLDVRSVEEYATGHATNAQNFDVEKLKVGTMPNIPKDATIYVYCRSGNRSKEAVTILNANGFTNVTDLGGLQNMKDAGVL